MTISKFNKTLFYCPKAMFNILSIKFSLFYYDLMKSEPSHLDCCGLLHREMQLFDSPENPYTLNYF